MFIFMYLHVYSYVFIFIFIFIYSGAGNKLVFLQHAQLLCSEACKLCKDGCAAATCTSLVLISVGQVGSIEPFVQLSFGGVLVHRKGCQ